MPTKSKANRQVYSMDFSGEAIQDWKSKTVRANMYELRNKMTWNNLRMTTSRRWPLVIHSPIRKGRAGAGSPGEPADRTCTGESDADGRFGGFRTRFSMVPSEFHTRARISAKTRAMQPRKTGNMSVSEIFLKWWPQAKQTNIKITKIHVVAWIWMESQTPVSTLSARYSPNENSWSKKCCKASETSDEGSRPRALMMGAKDSGAFCNRRTILSMK
mmetsp:Transcript_67039/g.170137  ORF Transcript_67039/g.170137 Transcript_67039/m.170137 type:complete len:216 (+) Transcript_67039:647-1294(+)